MRGLPSAARVRMLKAATAELVALLGGIEGAGATLERGKSVVGRWVNRSDAEHWIGVADLAALEMVAGRPVVTELLCKLAGGLFVPHIDLAADEGSVGWLVMRLSKELGDVSGEIATALGDHVLAADEAGRALAQLDELDTVSCQLRAVLGRVIGDRTSRSPAARDAPDGAPQDERADAGALRDAPSLRSVAPQGERPFETTAARPPQGERG